MALENEPPAERAYAYWVGWHIAGCSILLCGTFGSIGVAFLPAGYARVQTGDLPTGVAMMVIGVFGIPTLGMAFLSIYACIRDTFRPPVLRVTADALLLPIEARGQPPQDEYGEPIGDEPPHPEVVPFAAVRSIKPSGALHSRALIVAYDLSKEELRLERNMMWGGEFEELEAVLRAAVPAAFQNAPPGPQTI